MCASNVIPSLTVLTVELELERQEACASAIHGGPRQGPGKLVGSVVDVA